jgi:hypothetical protein
MDDSMFMSVGQRVGCLTRDPERLGKWRTGLPEETLPQ